MDISPVVKPVERAAFMRVAMPILVIRRLFWSCSATETLFDCSIRTTNLGSQFVTFRPINPNVSRLKKRQYGAAVFWAHLPLKLHLDFVQLLLSIFFACYHGNLSFFGTPFV
ncbi:unnamed protein product [Protopolystoma xenopodis]|uniref:Uncharacterized protein n=1 Tax=Protopolystoma xenopodis TaxID=117903 RepID=A0A3S5BDS9_9PLAT|nr:unnamed protein product [Protopolystoma xenopodis]